jgi:hypothetical protein
MNTQDEYKIYTQDEYKMNTQDEIYIKKISQFIRDARNKNITNENFVIISLGSEFANFSNFDNDLCKPFF